MGSRRYLRLEFRNFLAGRGVAASLIILLLTGFVAIDHGRRTIAAQRSVLAQAPQLQARHLGKMLALHGVSAAEEGPGNLLYYLSLFTRREPSAYAPLAIGLRDIAPYNLKVRMLALEGQLYDSEIGNPEAQALGNFDLAFLLTFLYPLLIIAFLHNVLSSEQEAGTWELVRSHPVSPLRVLLIKSSLRMLPVPSVWLATLAIAVVWLKLPLDGRFLALVAISLLYLLFWFALVLFVIAWGRSTTLNALALIACWLTLTILIPVTSNLGIAGALPASSAFDVALRQREGYHSKWDQPREETMRAFYARYPEYKSHQAPADRFSWAWYYAMHQMGDQEAAAASAEWRRTLQEREKWADRVALLAPPALVQAALSRLAATGLTAHLEYLNSVRRYHEQIRRFFYPHLFRDAPVPSVEWKSLPRHRFLDDSLQPDVAGDLSRLLVASGLCVALAAGALRRRIRRPSVVI